MSHDSTGLIRSWDLSGFDAKSLAKVSSLRTWDDWLLLDIEFLQTDEILTAADIPHGWEFQMWNNSGDPVGRPWFETEFPNPLQLPDGRSIVFNQDRTLIKNINGQLEIQPKHTQHDPNNRARLRMSDSTMERQRVILDRIYSRGIISNFENLKCLCSDKLLFLWKNFSQNLIIVDLTSERYINVHISHKIMFPGKRFLYCRRHLRLLLYEYDHENIRIAISHFGIAL